MKYQGQTHYDLEIAGLKRKLPIIEIKPGELWIASFVMLSGEGVTELNNKCAEELIKRFPSKDFDYLVVPEAKALPLAQSICQLLTEQGYPTDYIVLRKGKKSYMQQPEVVQVKSITTAGNQELVINGIDADKIRGKNVYLIDDVISTGGSYRSMVKLVQQVGANIKFAGAVLREGDFDLSDIERRIQKEIVYLKNLPVFTKDG